MPKIESPRDKLEGLQVLRGVAALLVLWCHLKLNLGQSHEHFAHVPLLATDFGAIGVDIFFVISGFVISMTAAKMGENWRAFLALRVARIVPLYFAVSTYMLLESILSSCLGGKPMRFSSLTIFDTYAFIPALDGRNFNGPILVNGWTLSFEMWFYLCFASLLWLGAGRRAWLWLPVFFTAGLLANLAFTEHGRWFLPKFLFHPITLEFCAGCVLYYARNRIGKSALYVMGGLGLLFLYLGYDQSSLGIHWNVLNDAMIGLHRTIIWGGFAACLVGILTQVDLKYSWKWPRILLLLGDSSYSIYLIPVAFMATVDICLTRLGKFAGHDLTPSPIWYGSIFVLGSIAAGIACWTLFELPATKLAKQFLFRFVPDQRSHQNDRTIQDRLPKQ
jgi:peptidoglycan/LPS O-acetylase OafA/YrhL